MAIRSPCGIGTSSAVIGLINDPKRIEMSAVGVRRCASPRRFHALSQNRLRITMSSLVKLSDLGNGAKAVVQKFSKTGAASLRLREMGLLAGTEITLVRTAPLGDPLEILVRGYHLTLRKSEGEQILVEPIA
jgi:ferrous iron transport protein A